MYQKMWCHHKYPAFFSKNPSLAQVDFLAAMLWHGVYSFRIDSIMERVPYTFPLHFYHNLVLYTFLLHFYHSSVPYTFLLHLYYGSVPCTFPDTLVPRLNIIYFPTTLVPGLGTINFPIPFVLRSGTVCSLPFHLYYGAELYFPDWYTIVKLHRWIKIGSINKLTASSWSTYFCTSRIATSVDQF